MAITQKSRWDDVGQEPPAGEAKYTAGEQPIAEYDNWFNKAVVDDIAALNQWLDNLGITKVYFDTEANKPASGATTELFIATDTNKIYRGTGTGWQEIPILSWDDIVNKPSVFPPETHQHADTDLLSIDWSKILNKPTNFPPEAHQHGRSDITDFFGSPFWDNIPDKPTEFPPSAHASDHGLGGSDELSLDASQITSGTLDVARIPSLTRSKISDFFSAPFWDNIPDKPSTFPSSPASFQLDLSSLRTSIDTNVYNESNIYDSDENTYAYHVLPAGSAYAQTITLIQYDFGTVDNRAILTKHRSRESIYDSAIEVSADGASWTRLSTATGSTASYRGIHNFRYLRWIYTSSTSGSTSSNRTTNYLYYLIVYRV